MTAQEITYHQDATAAYTLPNDATEQDRLEAQSHALVALMKNRPFQAPLPPSIQKIVDIGCGTAHLTTRLGKEHPLAKVYGVDLSPVPPIHLKPSNVDYIVGSFQTLAAPETMNPIFSPASFDYIFSRALIYGITDWTSHVSTMFSLAKPGTGWVELQEPEMIWRDRHGELVVHNENWLNTLCTDTEAKGLDPFIGGNLAKHMSDAGFVDIQIKTYPWVYNTEKWEEHPECEAIGAYSQSVLLPQFTRILKKVQGDRGGMSEKEYQEDVARSWREMGVGGHIRWYSVCGRRP